MCPTGGRDNVYVGGKATSCSNAAQDPRQRLDGACSEPSLQNYSFFRRIKSSSHRNGRSRSGDIYACACRHAYGHRLDTDIDIHSSSSDCNRSSYKTESALLETLEQLGDGVDFQTQAFTLIYTESCSGMQALDIQCDGRRAQPDAEQ